MGICRILGLVGSALCLGILILAVVDEGIPDKPKELFVLFSLLLPAFHFFPLPKRSYGLRQKNQS